MKEVTYTGILAENLDRGNLFRGAAATHAPTPRDLEIVAALLRHYGIKGSPDEAHPLITLILHLGGDVGVPVLSKIRERGNRYNYSKMKYLVALVETKINEGSTGIKPACQLILDEDLLFSVSSKTTDRSLSSQYHKSLRTLSDLMKGSSSFAARTRTCSDKERAAILKAMTIEDAVKSTELLESIGFLAAFCK